jgi:Spy/CpxP family protein refolding chaperone
MRTVRVLLILAVALLMARPLFAQDQPKEHKDRGPRGGGFGMDFLGERLLKDLNLTDEQKSKIKDLRAKFGRDSVLTDEQKKARTDAVEAAKKDGKNDREAFRAGAEAVRKLLTDDQKTKIRDNVKTGMEEFKKILTDEQKEKLEKLISKMREGRGRRGPDASK